jgi:hypothetical protein
MELITLKPKIQEKLIYLNDDKSSWVKLRKLQIENGGLNNLEFSELWKLKPKDKLKIKIYDKIIECPRYSRIYLKPYKFSGLIHEAEMILPSKVNEIMEWTKKEYNNPYINQSLINWYESNGSIGKHSDDTKQLIKDSEIYSFSFGPAIRTFILEPKNPKINNKKYNILLENNTLCIMGGKCQDTHYHSVPKNNIDLDKRLNITFRCFK